MAIAPALLCILTSVTSFSTLAATGHNAHQSHQFLSTYTRPDRHQICNQSLNRSRARSSTLLAIRGGNSADTSLNSQQPSQLQSLLLRAEQLLSQKDANGAFALLAEAYPLDPTSSKVASMFQRCMEINVEIAQDRFNTWRESAGAMQQIDFTEGELTNLFQDRMGLASLFIDKEQYDQAGIQLRQAIMEASLWLNNKLNLGHNDEANHKLPDLDSTPFQHWQPQIDQARYLLYRTNAACCKWDTYFQDGDELRKSLEKRTLPSGHVMRLLHPFDALKFPFVSLQLASRIAESYAHRALESVGVSTDSFEASQKLFQPRKVVNAVRTSLTANDNSQYQRKIRIGYLSPDFTSRHPLAFLMQHVFHYHDKSRFSVYTYSLSSIDDECEEVKAIRESSDCFTEVSSSGSSPVGLYQRILQDEIDILVDLCGYAGSSIVAEIMASRCKLQQDLGDNQSNTHFPLHVSYMGFPGSMGHSSIWDYSVFDKHVVPSSLRKHYSGALVYMPHCYFVNSHKTVIGAPEDGIMLANEEERIAMRRKYGIHPSAFVYCCHSRPDKIDPTTFRSWMRALCIAREELRKEAVEDNALPVLWLLRSGDQMEHNLREFVQREFGCDMEHALLFADVAERREHLKRLGCADLFLDTPAYNAHTLGCDALYMGLPMVSLLRNTSDLDNDNMANADIASRLEDRSIPTDKLASIVVASLLHAVSCEEFVVGNMKAYEDLMIKCATDPKWFLGASEKLKSVRSHSPLFDTQRWVRNLEAAFLKMKDIDLAEMPDIVVSEEYRRRNLFDF